MVIAAKKVYPDCHSFPITLYAFHCVNVYLRKPYAGMLSVRSTTYFFVFCLVQLAPMRFKGRVWLDGKIQFSLASNVLAVGKILQDILFTFHLKCEIPYMMVKCELSFTS